jgi:tripartite-type tricarboxylate transporter receptor subunit TctC
VPTLNETILPGFDVGTWFGLMAPAKTPSDIVNKLSTEITKIVNIPEVRKQLLATGAEPIGNTSTEMSAQVKKELDSFAALLKQIKLTVE